MEIDIILYGIARDIIGATSYSMKIGEGSTVDELLNNLKNEFPKLSLLTSLLIAVNDEYATMEYVIKENDEVVIIPPVSGG